MIRRKMSLQEVAHLKYLGNHQGGCCALWTQPAHVVVKEVMQDGLMYARTQVRARAQSTCKCMCARDHTPKISDSTPSDDPQFIAPICQRKW